MDTPLIVTGTVIRSLPATGFISTEAATDGSGQVCAAAAALDPASAAPQTIIRLNIRPPFSHLLDQLTINSKSPVAYDNSPVRFYAGWPCHRCAIATVAGAGVKRPDSNDDPREYG
ncbi:MAG: hypothetical protein ABI191_08155 [Rhizomicrobium sp.]